MKILLYNLKYFSLIAFLFILQNICYSQEEIPLSTRIDTSKLVKSDTLTLDLKSNIAVWEADAEEIDKLITEDIGDFVQVLPNVFSLDLGSLGQFSPLMFRGSTPQDGSILMDGLILEDPIQGFLNSKNIPINIVENIMFQGPGSFSYFGTQALSGIFQVNTYQFQASQPYSKVIFRAGDFGYSDIGIIFGLPLTKAASLLIGGNRQELDGFVINGGHEGSRIHSKISYQPDKNFALRYSVLLNKDKVEVPAPLLPDLVLQNSIGRRKENRSDHALAMKYGNLANKNYQFQARIFLSKIQQESFADTLLFKNRNTSFGIGIQQDILTANHWFTFGGEFKIHDLNSLRLGNQTDQVGYIYFGEVYHFAKNWQFGIQGRLEKYEDYSAALNPSAYFNYNLTPIMYIWLGVQRVRRYPSFAERYWPTEFFRGTPKLEVEKGTAFEVGYKINKEKTFNFEASLFRHHVENWIGKTLLADSSAFGPMNLGQRTIDGFDLKFIWNYIPGGQFGFIGSFLKVEEGDLKKQLEVPEFSLYSYLELGHSFFQDYVFVTLRLMGRFFGKRYGLLYNLHDSVFPGVTTLHETAVLDGKITFQFSDASIFLSMENLLNKKYQLVPGFLMPPETFRFGIVWEFLD